MKKLCWNRDVGGKSDEVMGHDSRTCRLVRPDDTKERNNTIGGAHKPFNGGGNGLNDVDDRA